MLNLNKSLILASESPRRREILEQAGFVFSVTKANVEESYPDHFKTAEVPVYLAEKKADYFKKHLEGKIILASDTVVALNDKILGKPTDQKEAREYLNELSDRVHQVISGVCLLSEDYQESFYDLTKVVFRELDEKEINYYIDQYQPYDKAGAYAIQEWIGMIGIEKIEGSYFNVMGLPIHKVYEKLRAFSVWQVGGSGR